MVAKLSELLEIENFYEINALCCPNAGKGFLFLHFLNNLKFLRHAEINPVF